MSKNALNALVAVTLVILPVVCVDAAGFWNAVKEGGSTIVNWNDVPIEEVKDKPFCLKEGCDPEKVVRKAAEEFATMYKGSATVSKTKVGQLSCTLDIRKHSAVVSIVHGDGKFSISHVSSVNLRYDDAKHTIHPTFNEWMKVLSEKIIACAAAGRESDADKETSAAAPAATPAATTPVAATPAASTPPAPKDDIKARLERLKKLKDEGILTEEEYKTKRAEVLKDI